MNAKELLELKLGKRNRGTCRKSAPQCHNIHNYSHMTCSGLERGLFIVALASCTSLSLPH
jgi:hypothetical protein